MILHKVVYNCLRHVSKSRHIEAKVALFVGSFTVVSCLWAAPRGSHPGPEAGKAAKSDPDLVVFDETLHSSFEDWSWAERDLGESQVVKSGARSIRFLPRSWRALYFHARSTPLSTKSYQTLKAWVRLEGAPSASIRLSLGQLGGDLQVGEVFKLSPGSWQLLSLDLRGASAQLGPAFDKIYIQSWEEGGAGTIYVDDVTLEAVSPAAPKTVWTPQGKIHVTFPQGLKSGRPISDLIYGARAWSPEPRDTKLQFPLRRFGGNASSRYNYRHNASNAGADWFYLNMALPYQAASPQGPGDGPGRELSLVDSWIETQVNKGRDMLVTIPMMGWVARDRSSSWGYPVAKFGTQQKMTSIMTANDAGNGRRPDGTPLRTGDVTLTSVKIDPGFVAGWVKSMGDLTPRAMGKKGVRFVALDNEPSLWHETHQDVRYGDPQGGSQGPVGFDEIWQRTVAYASAVKKVDPEVQILGPDSWGWCDYFGFGLDQCEDGPDRRRHGGEPFLKWYMKKVCTYQKEHGVRLVDYLDIHYYPANIQSDAAESPKEQDARLAAVRSWYDPTYVDGSWIKEPQMIIPRMRDWIKESCPGLKLAVTEWRWGVSPHGLATALAHAESLALFGREGVDLAAIWSELPEGSLGEQVFRLFLDYDGRGASALGGTSHPLASSRGLDGPAYAIQTKDSLLVYVFNKTRDAQSVAIDAPPGQKASRLFVLDQEGLRSEVSRSLKDWTLPPLSVGLIEYAPDRRP